MDVLESQLVIDGDVVAARSGATFDRCNPLTEDVVTRAAAAGAEDAAAAANSAAAAFAGWAATPPEERAAILRTASRLLGERMDALAASAAGEVGASSYWSRFNVEIAQKTLEQAASLATRIEDRILDNPESGMRSILRRQPAGVVLGFAPWNAPITLAIRAVAAPLACGNTVVLKGSEYCARTQQMVVEVLNDAGLPPGVANFVINAPAQAHEVAEALIGHPAVRRVNFTGSTRVGREIAMIAARHLKQCLLELSGKAPMIILEDADLDAAAEAAAFGAFLNQGQICMSTERIIVIDTVADELVERLVKKAREIAAGDPRDHSMQLGPLIGPDAALRLRGLIDDAVDKGAALLHGGDVRRTVMQPTVIDHVSSMMRLYHEECFGPIASILRVADEDEAVSIANDTEFGLSASVYSRDEARALAIADRIESGMCHINGPTVCDDPEMPFGGVKSSGYGRFGGDNAINEFTELRWLAVHDGTPRHPLSGG